MELKRLIENTGFVVVGAGAGEVLLNSANHLGTIPPEQHFAAIGMGILLVGGVLRTGIDLARRPVPPSQRKPQAGKTMGEIDQSLSEHHGDPVSSAINRLPDLITIDPITKRKL